jgi:hypothetical protein
MNQVEALEQQLLGLKNYAERGEMARRLAQNPDFKKLILEDFCVTECARYAQQSGDPALGVEERQDALALAQAAGHLKRFLSIQIRLADQAANEIVNVNEAIEEARLEEEAPAAVDADYAEDAD